MGENDHMGRTDREPGRPVRVGLTGGMATGKSTVAGLLRERGAVVIDYDRLAHEVVEPGSVGLQQVVDAFGSEVLAEDGSLDRQALARLAFSDPQRRCRLEGIIHPLVDAEADRIEARAAQHAGAVVVHDIPLLVETGRADDFDLVIVTDIDPDEQVRRVVERDGRSPEDARARIAAQTSRQRRLAAADVVIDTAGSIDDLPGKVDRAWGRILSMR